MLYSMKKYITYLLSFVLISGFVACTKSDDVFDPSADGRFVLRLVSNTLTRANVPDNGVGEGTNYDDNHEDDIWRVDIYFYAGDGSSAAVYHYGQDVTDGEDGNTSISEIELSSSVVSGLFPSGASTATIYVVANAPAGLLTTTSGNLPTLSALKSTTAVLASWKTSAEDDDPSSAQESFLMDGEVTFSKTDNAVEIALTRAAAKIELEISKIKESVEIEGAGNQKDVWTPVIDAKRPVTVSLSNGMRSTQLNGVYNNSNPKNTYDDSQKGYGFTPVITTDTNGKQTTTYTQTNPFYSYASDWANGANEPYLLLTVCWSKNGEDPEATYYQIPVGSIIEKKIERNTYYKVKIDVGTVGSQEESVPVPLAADYTVINWTTGQITANIKEARYLVVDQTNVVLNNLQDISVAFQSSHPVSYKIVEHTFKTVYTSSGKTWNTVLGFSTTNSEGTGYVKQTGGTTEGADGNIIGSIDFHHELDNTREDNGSSDPEKRYDYQANTVKIKVYHTDAEDAYYEYITIEQRPALYLTIEPGISGSVFVNKVQETNNSRMWDYVGEGTVNMSGNIYRITVSAFDSSSKKYIICDPRIPSNDDVFQFYKVNTNGTANTNSPVATATDAAGDNTLTGYRATIEGDASEKYVAPEFIMASAYGHYQPTWNNMYAKTSTKYRCAGYQEAGYPAGRWRIPTPSELEVIGRLCSEGKIESIFNDGTAYMSSNGPYTYHSGSFTKAGGLDAATGSVRCVYDTWYWKDKLTGDNVTKFIWAAEGDMEENIGNKKQYLAPVQ